jgi:Type ISP C-terminal specificity domain/N-6 DNA Methylase
MSTAPSQRICSSYIQPPPVHLVEVMRPQLEAILKHAPRGGFGGICTRIVQPSDTVFTLKVWKCYAFSSIDGTWADSTVAGTKARTTFPNEAMTSWNIVPSVSYTVAQYLTEIRAIRNTGSATAETSFYPAVTSLFNASGQSLKPPVLFSTQLRSQGAGLPDGGFFPQPKTSRRNAEPPPLQNPERGVVEIKPADYNLDTLTTEPQTIRYLQQYGLVLITNLREFRLLEHNPVGPPNTRESYVLAITPNDLWHRALDAKHNDLLPDFLARVMLYKAPLTQPKDVAWLLASYAREARARAEDHPLGSFHTVKLALQESLGIQFEGDKGEHFFRSTLVQTLFYGIFSAWILWRRSPEGRTPDAHFDWRISAHYLRVPVLRKLFGEVADPGALNSLQLQEVLNLAGEALNRVQPAFFDTFREDEAVAYFYEPFLEAFDPQLRKDLGVWYTPKEIVQYMVERVDHLLRTQLHQPLGLASPAVRILDPCCGTGAYLTEVLHRIHRTLLEQAGDDTALIPDALRTAALTRVFGFEIMPAPFVIAHLQFATLLEKAGAPLTDDHRAGVFLTNALTGWVPVAHPKSIFAEMEQEREAADNIKQQGTILVILGNPPYNGYAGIAKIEEERDLTTAYRAPVQGLPAPQGQGLNDLYIRFFRIAERRIASNADGQGIVSFISNNAWLDGLSHTTMRHQYLHTFQQLFIDNLNGDKYRTGKTTPEGLPDPSAFSTPHNREGIQVGTAIATLVRNTSGATATPHLRGLWGAGKLEQLKRESKREAEPAYVELTQAPALGNPFAHRIHSLAYTSWPLFPELMPTSFPGVQTGRDDLVADIARDTLEIRMQKYLNETVSHTEMESLVPGTMIETNIFQAAAVRLSLQRRGYRPWQLLPFAYRPYDTRWLYWEPTTSLLDRKREDYQAQYLPTVPVMYLAQKNRKAFDPPGITYLLGNRHLNERGANMFPFSTMGEPLPGQFESRPNISDNANGYLCEIGAEAPSLFFHALATMHTPQYTLENSGALLSDWPRIPLPATAELLAHSATLGCRLAELLDPESSLNLAAEWSFLSALKLPQNPNLEEALKLTAGWGSRGKGSTVMPGRGKATQREWSATERDRLATLAASQNLTREAALTLLGETCLDIHLNGDALWSAVPANVWSYTLGGYQVLKNSPSSSAPSTPKRPHTSPRSSGASPPSSSSAPPSMPATRPSSPPPPALVQQASNNTNEQFANSPDLVNGSHRFLLRDSVWEASGVRDVTKELREVTF